jgi:branched-chain amino acid transport system ATP-binding protein
MLEVKQLVSGYGRMPILHDLELSVADGECVGILGHNGMGKTTLLRTLVGHIKAMSGSIALNGNDITALPAHRRARARIGYVPQGREIFPALTVRENLLMGALSGSGGRASVIDEVLEDFPRLRTLLDRNGSALSGGEQQLLAMARCLCGRPQVMLLDEPTEGIQPSIIDEIVDLLTELQTRTSISIVLVEQNLDFIKALSDRVLLMHRGQITQTITPAELDDPEIVNEFVGMS